MGAAVATRPAGMITRVFKDSAAREGAYRLLESGVLEADEIGHSAGMACARRASGQSVVFVPVDETGLGLRGTEHRSGLGPVAARSDKGMGLRVVSAIGLAHDGVPLGLLSQSYWARPEKADSRSKRERRHRPIYEKENWHTFDAIQKACSVWNEGQATAKLWFLIDRGGDFAEALLWQSVTQHFVTIRAAQDRRVAETELGTRHLWSQAEAQAALGSYELKIVGSHGRKKRTATIAVKSCQVDVLLRTPANTKRGSARLTAVLAIEQGTTPQGEDPIEWLLLTNAPVESFADAIEVVRGYALRWRIEDFHKTWKVTCGVEKNQLQDGDPIAAWATILAAAAMRIERLKHLARNTPDLPASVEFGGNEIEAIIRLRNPKGWKPGQVPPIHLAVLWIADLGGYTGKSSGGPPGAITLAEGLKLLEGAARMLASVRND
jgi:hypothetical protein